MNDFYAELISLGIRVVYAIISIIVTTVLVPWLKNTVVPWLKEKRMYNIVKHFVQAAEKMAESEQITKEYKKKYVVSLLDAKGITVDDEVNALIESAVEELDMIISATTEIFYEDDNESVATTE